MQSDTSPDYSGPALCALTAREAVARLRAGSVSALDLIEAAEVRAAKVESTVNALPTQCSARARSAVAGLAAKAARNGDEPGWLAGLPLAIKDLTPVVGVRTTFGSSAFADFVPTESDPLVEMIEARGGLVVAKSNTPEFGAGANTFNPVFGPTRNPWDTRLNAGGSSGGAAAALVTGEVWLAHGSDLAGSLRTPAAYCGVVGLRPSPGRCGGGPAPAAFLIEGLSGPMARDVGDLALFLDTMAGFDPRMPLSLEAPRVSFQDALAADPGPIRIAFAPDLGGFAAVEADMAADLAAAMARLSDGGISVEEACPNLPGLDETYRTLRAVHFGTLTDRQPDHVRATFKATIAQNAAEGRALTSAAIYDAHRQRTVLYQKMRVFLERYDVLALPVVGLHPRAVEEEFPPAVAGQPCHDYIDWLRFSFLATTCALPALSLPVGFSAAGLPVGLQLVGPPRGEARLLQVAARCEAILGRLPTPIDPVVRHL